MAKSEITLEQAQVVIDRVKNELGLLEAHTSGFIKIQGPNNRHRIYVQKSKRLGRIDFTVDLPADDPAYKQLEAPNGSIKCHIVPTLEQLERCLRMLGDPSLGTQVPNKPRPFAATKQPARKPKAVAAPVAEEVIEPVPKDRELKDRLSQIKDRVERARAMMIVENPDIYGSHTFDEALDLVQRKVDLSELKAQAQAEKNQEVADVLAETGIEVA